MISYESLGSHRKAKFDQWVRYRWVLSFRFERMKHLTNRFKHSYIDPRKTDTCC